MNPDQIPLKQSSLNRLYRRKISLLNENQLEIWVDTLSLWIAIPTQILLLIPIFRMIIISVTNGIEGFYNNIFNSSSALYIVLFVIIQGNFLISIFSNTILIKLNTYITSQEFVPSSNFILSIGENEFKGERFSLVKTGFENKIYKVSGEALFGQPYAIKEKIVLKMKEKTESKYLFIIPRIPFSFYSRLTINLKGNGLN